MSTSAPLTVLLTGASTGIGRVSALHLARKGYRVLATVRRDKDAASLRAEAVPGLEPVIVDVDKAEDIERIGQQIDAEPGGLYALINNAGFNYNAPFEQTVEARARAMMETNFFGLYRLSQRLIPALRRGAEQAGQPSKLVNVSSIGGSIGLPWESFYHASKFAVLGLSESLRNELYAQNIRVVVVQPGGIQTDFMPKTEASLQTALAEMTPEGRSRYAKPLETMLGLTASAAKYGTPPVAVAKAFERILGRRNPGFRTWVGLDARILHALHAVLPYWLMHAMLRRLSGA
ncbi:MAG: SDR family NAD(P)-dependent oxidoreductase [Deltaproteobacteria bacterium]|nr:SDR family NAD(P)-dependent oxidoreductase [Deltaproteobacteria bacterium]